MAQYDQLTELLDLPNVRVIHYQLVGASRLNLFVESTLAAALCPTCHQPSLVVHARDDAQLIRDLPIWQRQCWLRYVPRRFDCATCQTTFVERVVWRDPGRTSTTRYEQALYERVRREPISQVAHDEHLTEDIVQGIFDRWAKKNWAPEVTRE
jgi:transposase